MHAWALIQKGGAHLRMQHDWQNALWKLLTNPAFEVVAAIVVVLIAAWFVIDTEMLMNPAPRQPQGFGHK